MSGAQKIIITVINDICYDQRMLKSARTLITAGYEVTIVGRQLKNTRKKKMEGFKPVWLKCIFNKGKLFYIEYNIRLLVYILRQNTDIVLATDLDTLLAAFISSKIRDIDLVYDAHEFFTEVPELQNRKISKNIWRCLESFLLPKIKHCYTVSQGVADLFKERYKKQFRVIRNVPLKKEIPFLNNEERLIIYQGALNVGRGLEYMIRAMRQIEAKLIIVGEGDISKDLKDITIALKLEEKVSFMGSIDPYELSSVTRSASLGLNLLEPKGLNYIHSLANKFFDYIEAGIPQLCMRFPEYLKINEAYEVAVMLEGLNELYLAKTINDLFNDKEYYNKLRNNALKAREVLCWQNEEIKLLEIFNNI